MIPKESPLSIAAYHGNVEMVDLLKKHELLLPHHFPQAFREAAGAGRFTQVTATFLLRLLFRRSADAEETVDVMWREPRLPSRIGE